MFFNSTGNDNTACGYNALYDNIDGIRNTGLGYLAKVGSVSLNNATAIGAQAQVDASNSLVLGSINGVNGATSSVNVGIGTTAPTERLQVGGNIFASGGDFYTAGANGVINAGGGIMNSLINIISDVMPTPLNADGDEDLYIQDDLELGGQGYKPGGGTWATPSDARLKKDITPYTDGLQQLLQIKPVRYRYNDIISFNDGGKTYIGVLAQDMAKIAPYTVELMPFGQKVSEDERGIETITDPGTLYYTYDGTALTYMLINAVKEQQDVIKGQQQEIDVLKTQLGKITAALQTAGISIENKQR